MPGVPKRPCRRARAVAFAAAAAVPIDAVPIDAVPIDGAFARQPTASARQDPEGQDPARQDPARQDPGAATDGARDRPTLAATTAAVEDWLANHWSEAAPREAAARLVIDAEGGLAWLGEQLRAAGPAQASARATRLDRLTLAVVLAFVDRVQASGVQHRGQYGPLAALQPQAGDHLLGLLLEPPFWFDTRLQVLLVPALRDLLSAPPDPARLDAIVAMARDVEGERGDLRRALSCLLWQWGRREFVEQRLLEWRRATAEGDAEDRVYAFRQMADLHYRVGEYARAAKTHAALQRMADGAGIELTPTDWYWSACYHALAGQIDAGIAALERCAERNASPSVDVSIKLPRSLFATDPEIEKLRADPRFPAVVTRAFPGRDEPRDGSDRDGIDRDRDGDR